tara:strand:+ start:1034 stop:2401 length:1368 start_codon:yes stop_codon:yes gene_type:complete
MKRTVPQILDVTKNNRFQVIFAIISAMLVVLVVFFSEYILDAKAINKSDVLSYKHLNYTDKLTIHMLTIESNARGYLLSQNDSFLIPFYDGIDKLEKLLRSLERAWPNYLNPTEIDMLNNNIDIVIKQLAKMIENKNLSKNNKLSDYNQSKIHMDTLRDQVLNIRKIILKRIRQNQTINLSSLETMKWIMLSLSSLAFSLLLLLFIQTRRYQDQAKAYALTVAQKNNHLEKAINKRTVELVDLASHMTTTSENEKKRIARELHDELGALLTAVRMDTTWLKRHLKPKDSDPIKLRLDRLLEVIDQSIAIKRAITTSLVPPLLRELGLIEAIKAMTEDLPDDHATTYRLTIQNELPKVDSDRELALYRICQESLTNIRKYADANHVDIKLGLIKGKIELTIKDDGKGFSPELLKRGTHGISGMRARAAMFSGVLTIKSNAKEGTSVRASIPLAATD